MFTRALVSLAVLMCVTTTPAFAQAPSSSWEVAFGAHGLRRDDATHAGGAVAAGVGGGNVMAVVEAGGTRRGGHNDWRIVAGPRVRIVGGAGAGLFAQALAGAAIRNNATGFGWTAGVGADLGGAGRLGFRIQFDVVGERRENLSRTGGRASAWVVLR